jgi:hypothetical protein
MTALAIKKECPTCRQPINSQRALRADAAFVVAVTPSATWRSSVTLRLEADDDCPASGDDTWNCRLCTLLNPAAAERCATCHARRPVSATSALLSRNEAAPAESKMDVAPFRKTQNAARSKASSQLLPAAAPAALPTDDAQSDGSKPSKTNDVVASMAAAARPRRRARSSAKGEANYRGVYKHGRKFRARLHAGRDDSRYIGSFDTAEEAASALAVALEERRQVQEQVQGVLEAARASRLPQQAEAARQQAAEEGLELALSSKNTSTGFLGVYEVTSQQGGKFRAMNPTRLVSADEAKWIGHFETAEEAALAYARSHAAAKAIRARRPTPPKKVKEPRECMRCGYCTMDSGNFYKHL